MTATHRQALIDHALEGGDDEVCGFLVGLGSQVEQVMRVRNAAAEITADNSFFIDPKSGRPRAGEKRVHFFVDSRDLVRAYGEAEEQGLEIIGVYHSHTHTEAKPSPTDIRNAHDNNLFYVLVGLQDRSAPQVRAWRITKQDEWAGEEGELTEVAIVDRN